MHKAFQGIDLVALKAKHGEIHGQVVVVDEVEHAFIIRSPSRAQYFRFVNSAKTQAATAIDQLVRDVLVHPSLTEYSTLTDAKPGVVMGLGAMVHELAGPKEAEFQGKL